MLSFFALSDVLCEKYAILKRREREGKEISNVFVSAA